MRDRGPTPRRFRRSRELARGLLAAAVTVTACGGDEDIETPTPRFTESPVEYPLELWDRDIEGSTLVRVLVNEEGGVDSAMVMESSGHAGLDSAAVRGARSMEFDPATKDGEPLKVWARVPVRFSKDAKPTPPGPADDPGAGAPPAGAAANPNVTSGLGSVNESGPEPGEAGAGSTGSRGAGSDRA